MRKGNTMNEVQSGAVVGAAPPCDRCGGRSVLYVVDENDSSKIYTCLKDHGTVVAFMATGAWPELAPASVAIVAPDDDDRLHSLRGRLPAAPADNATARLLHTIA